MPVVAGMRSGLFFCGRSVPLKATQAAHHLTLTAFAVGAEPRATHLQPLLQAILAPYQDEEQSRVTIEGGDTAVGPLALPSLALLLHELATNAAKYGALAGPDGTLFVKATLEEASLSLKWLEQVAGGYRTPSREGFGTHLETASLRSLNGVICRD